MSKSCEHIEHLFDGWYRGELSANEKYEVDAHLAKCSDCASVWEQKRQLMDSLNDPYADKIEEAYPVISQNLKQKNPVSQKPTITIYRYYLAVAAVLLAGFVGGIIWMLNQQSLPPTEQEISFYDLETSLKNDISSFFNRAEILFMSLGHLDMNNLDNTDYSFTIELGLAGKLVEEADRLQQLLVEQNQHHLADLMEECAILLRTLDRQAEPEDYETIWLVHKTAADRSIVPRISLERFRLQSFAAAQY